MQQNQLFKKIVFLDRVGLPERFSVRAPELNHRWNNYDSTSPEHIIERSIGADVLITNKVKITRETLLACPSVEHIAVAATGFNVIDIDACRELGVSVSNIPSYAATTVAEHVIASALCLRRQLLSYRQSVINGEWQKSRSFCLFGDPINDLKNSIFAVIGFGELGRAAAEKAAALGMRVIFASRGKHRCEFAKQVSFDEVITSADIISIHCSLTAETSNLISTPQLRRMQPHAILINTARGGIVNEVDVVQAINDKLIGGISFDVLIGEPPSDDSPLLSIANLENVIITPHSAWASEQAMQRLADILADNVDAFLLGSPKNLVS
ncbi:MAG: glycerate dehydrogenase [Arenicella sp.]|nr:glycerate dehydrogenase [Arenicella sp.]